MHMHVFDKNKTQRIKDSHQAYNVRRKKLHHL